MHYLLALTIMFLLIGAYVWTLVACARDARRRGKEPWLVVLLVMATFPVGLLAWLLLRPELVEKDEGKKGFDLERFRVQ